MSTAATIEYTVFPTEVYNSDEEVRPRSRVTTPAQADVTTHIYGNQFATHFAKLDKIAVTPTLWLEQTERPHDIAIEWARYILQTFEDDNLPPTRVVASAEGGIAICFIKGNKYADIECLNNGEILGVTSNRRDRPTVWEVLADASEIARATARIRLFFDPPSTNENVARRSRR